MSAEHDLDARVVIGLASFANQLWEALGDDEPIGHAELQGLFEQFGLLTERAATKEDAAISNGHVEVGEILQTLLPSIRRLGEEPVQSTPAGAISTPS
jgi:hypothetical protein